jgi:phosphoserine phosphatase
VILKDLRTEARSNFSSAAEFVERMLEQRPRTAIFDCDGTLWAGDAGSEFLTWSLEHGMVSRETADWILGRYSQYRQGLVTQAGICGEMTQMYAGLREDEIRAAAEKFFRDVVAPHIFVELEELTGKLRQSGAELWAVSSTNVWVIEPAVARFGIPAGRVLGARVAVRDGVATSTLLAVPTGPDKVAALQAAGVDAPDAVFGNSVHDAAMLAAAKRACAVNPTPALAVLAESEGWPIYWPESVVAARGRTGLEHVS